MPSAPSEPTNPNFQSIARPAAEDEGRGGFGPPRRFDREHAAPREVLPVRDRCAGRDLLGERRGTAVVGEGRGGAQDDRVGAVGEDEQRDRLARTGPFQRTAQQQRRLRGTGVAHDTAEPVDDSVGRDAELLRDRAGRALVRARDDEMVDLVRAESGVLQRGFPRLDTQARVAGLAEPFLPHLRPDVAGRAPAVDEFLGRAVPRDDFGEHRRVVVAADQQRGRAVATRGFVGTAGQPAAQVGGHDERGTRAAERGAERAEPGSHRADRVVRGRAPRRGAAPRAPPSRWSCRRRPARPSRTTRS